MKKALIFGTVLCASAMFVGNASAATVSEIKSWGSGTNIEVTGDNDNYVLKLIGDAKQDLVINEGKSVTIDLGEYTLTNSGGIYCTSCSAITIADGIQVTITGNGTIKRSSDAVGNASTIDNQGNLTIESGTIEAPSNSATANLSAAISNRTGATLTINGGTIKTVDNGAWGISNTGIVSIIGGTFIQSADFSIIENSGEMTIENGTFTATEEGTHNSLLTNSTADATLTITGGTFDSKYTLSGRSQGEVVISGGKFTETESVINYLEEGLAYDENGNVVEAPKQEETPKEEDKKQEDQKEENKKQEESKKEEEKVNTDKKDKEPKTNDVLPIALIALLCTSALTGIYTFKKN